MLVNWVWVSVLRQASRHAMCPAELFSKLPQLANHATDYSTHLVVLHLADRDMPGMVGSLGRHVAWIGRDGRPLCGESIPVCLLFVGRERVRARSLLLL